MPDALRYFSIWQNSTNQARNDSVQIVGHSDGNI